MKTGDVPFPSSPEPKPVEILQEFVAVFAGKGWLNQTLRIKHREGRYRVFCSESKFFAYRINDHSGVSWGFPGWPVCIVTHEEIVDDSQGPPLASAGLTAHEWLRCLAGDDFELI